MHLRGLILEFQIRLANLHFVAHNVYENFCRPKSLGLMNPLLQIALSNTSKYRLTLQHVCTLAVDI